MRTPILVAIVCFLAIPIARADTPDPDHTATSAGGNLLVTPAAMGPTLAEIGATVTVTLRAPNGDPIVGYPAQDAWLDDTGTGELSFCLFGATADQDSDASGTLTFSRALAGGGSTQVGVYAYVAGIAIQTTLPIVVASPDLDADLKVDLADVGIFASALASGADPRADLDFDGTIGLGDVGIFAQHFGEACP